MKVKGAAAAKSLQSCPTLWDPIDAAHQAPPPLGFSRQEHWNGLPSPSPMHESEKWKWSLSVMSKVKGERKKVDLKLNMQKTNIMASGPITSWQNYGETLKTVRDFILGGSKITEDGDCRHEIKRCLLLRRKVVTNVDSILKSRDITLPTKVPLVRLWFFQESCMDVRVGP